jgi:hypothetical protein
MAAASDARYEGDLDRLYQLPLAETSARDELVKRGRPAEGARDQDAAQANSRRLARESHRARATARRAEAH